MARRPLKRLAKDQRIGKCFGQMLAQRRTDMKMKPEQVADLIGCSPATVLYHEAGAAFLPRPWLFFGFAAALELSPRDMFLAAYYAMPKATKVVYLRVVAGQDPEMAEEVRRLAA